MKRLAIYSFLTAACVSAAHAQSAVTTQIDGSLTRPRTVTSALPTQTQQQTPTPATQAPTTQTPRPTNIQETPAQPATSAPARPVQQSLPPASSAIPPSASMPQGAHSISVNKVRAHISEAERLFKTKPVQTAFGGISTNIVTLAALDPDGSQIHLLMLPKDTFLLKGADTIVTSSLGRTVEVRIVRANGVNTAVTLFDTATQRALTPLVIEYPIEKGGVFREMAYYTSVHPALVSPDIIQAGKTYVRTMVDLAAKRLKDKGVTISPNIQDIAERLCIVEHIDHERFRLENRIALYEEIFSLYALNELDTFRYSVSSAGAGGMVQMIPWTYQMIRQRHPAVGLNPDFVAGMRNHGNALEAMLLYMQDTWNDLVANSDVSYALGAKLATPAELMAAGYNSNPAKLGQYIRRGGSDWRLLIPRETQTYLQIYKSLDSLIPMKTRG